MTPPPETGPSRTRWKAAAALTLISGAWLTYPLIRSYFDSHADAERIRETVASEELILHLTPKLKSLTKDLLDLRLPSPEHATEHFNPDATVDGNPAPTPLSIWSPTLETIDYFDHAALKIVRGKFLDSGHTSFETDVAFAARARSKDGGWLALKAKLLLSWAKSDTDQAWRIAAWKTKSFDTQSTPQLFFTESLDRALPREGDRYRARRSIHEEESAIYYKSGRTRARHLEFAPIAMNQKPAVSVVDIDGDGFDDLYVMVRLGQNLLLHNRGDGTFIERAADFELAISGHSTAALFADFDNDGDKDLFLARSIERCIYLENTGTWFREKQQPFELPYLAVSLAAADYNNDGLLDLYIATYRPEALGADNPGLGNDSEWRSWPERYLPADQAVEYQKRFAASRDGSVANGGFLDQVGPPNVLLVNRGGGEFAVAPESTSLETWENTLQAAWSDYDNDGDQDLYLAHDFAPDQLFRNDGPAGFTDVSRASGFTMTGFGMGASWGDYDADGRPDLYVSNMFSKAGTRILAGFAKSGNDYRESAAGNFLYRQQPDGTFALTSGHEPPKLTVAKAGWSWGGHFADFDNDADLDIYALSGYFTAPRGLESDVDL